MPEAIKEGSERPVSPPELVPGNCYSFVLRIFHRDHNRRLDSSRLSETGDSGKVSYSLYWTFSKGAQRVARYGTKFFNEETQGSGVLAQAADKNPRPSRA
jgi:hypothetical protein